MIFDGGKGGDLVEGRDVYKGIKVLYSPLGKTADDLIKGLVDREGEKTLVITPPTGSWDPIAGFARPAGFAPKTLPKRYRKHYGVRKKKNLRKTTQRPCLRGKRGRLIVFEKEPRKYWEYL